MIKKVTITNFVGESVEYKIEGVDVDHNNGLLITEIEGLGPVKADINMTKLATADGEIFNSARLNGRNIKIKALFTYANTIEEARLSSYKFFPIGKPLTFRIETDNRIGETVGRVESNEPDIFSDESEMDISIVCEDSFFLSPNKDVTLFSGVEPLFEFNYHDQEEEYNGPEYENEGHDPVTEFGEIVNKKTNTVFYSGDSETGCIFEIHAIGLVENVTIYNLRTRERMKIDTDKLNALTGNKLIAGDTITICTIKGQKSATLLREGVETNILNTLGKNIDWFQLAKGDNVFGFVAEYGEENIQFKITSQVAYEGV